MISKFLTELNNLFFNSINLKKNVRSATLILINGLWQTRWRWSTLTRLGHIKLFGPSLIEYLDEQIQNRLIDTPRTSAECVERVKDRVHSGGLRAIHLYLNSLLLLHRITQPEQITFAEKIPALGGRVPWHRRHDHGHSVRLEYQHRAQPFGHGRVHFNLRLSVHASDSVDVVKCVPESIVARIRWPKPIHFSPLLVPESNFFLPSDWDFGRFE